jgi:dethiobiotin synthetase
MSLVVVVGTGTEIGKTTFTVALTSTLRARGANIAAWKPIETGPGSDAAALSEAAGVTLAPRFRFDEPISPHLAARHAGTAIRIGPIVDLATKLRAEHELLLLETAGGLFSPLDDDGATNASLVAALAPERIILVAPNRLGVLHDVTAATIAAGTLGLAIQHCVLSSVGAADDPSRATNAAELVRLRALHVKPWHREEPLDGEWLDELLGGLRPSSR